METSSAVWRHRGSAPGGADPDPDRSGPPEEVEPDDGVRGGGLTPAPPPPPPDRSDLRLGRTILTMGALALVAVVYVLHAALPATPFKLPLDNRQVLRTVAPEGWGFFTISPRVPDVVAYGARPDGRWRPLTVGAHGPGSLFGLDRRDRSQGTEVGIVVSQVPPDDWFGCDREPLACLTNLTARPGSVVNYSHYRSLCGDVGLVMQDVLPWAWRELPTVMPSKVIRVVVSC